MGFLDWFGGKKSDKKNKGTAKETQWKRKGNTKEQQND